MCMCICVCIYIYIYTAMYLSASWVLRGRQQSGGMTCLRLLVLFIMFIAYFVSSVEFVICLIVDVVLCGQQQSRGSLV